MTKAKHENIVQWDGMKAVTIWGDEGWTITSGNDKERPDTEVFYSARVPAVYRGMMLIANKCAAVPFDIVDASSGEIIDTTDEYTNELGFLPHPELMFWKIAASWVVNGRAYIYQSKNGAGYPTVFRWLANGSVKYNPDKDTFTRSIQEGSVKKDKTYPGAIDENGKPSKGESIVYLWMQDPDVEKGPPWKWPAKAALQAMGVLFNMDESSTGFFKRGMLHVKAFRVPPGTQPSDKEQFEDKVRNLLSGIKNAWRTIFLDMDKVDVIDMGGGLDELANLPLTKEKREDICIALGIPMSKLFPDASNGLGGKGVVDADDKRLVFDTVIPQYWRPIARILNEQVFTPLGYRLEEHSERMPEAQVEEGVRATSLSQYVDAFTKDMELAGLLADQLGITLSDDLTAYIKTKKKEKEKAKKNPPAVPPQPQNQIVPNDPNAQSNTPEMSDQNTKFAADLRRYQTKALKHIGEPVHFESDVIPLDTMLKIDGGLKACKTADDVKALFASVTTPETPHAAIVARLDKLIEAIV